MALSLQALFGAGGEPGADPRIVRERLRLAYGGMTSAYVAAAIVSTLLVPALWGDVSTVALLGWWGYMVVSTAVRAWFARRTVRELEADDADSDGPSRRFALAVLAAALGWGALALFVPALDDPAHRALIAATVAGVTSGSAPVYAFVLPAARLFLTLTLVPLIAAYLVNAGTLDGVLGAAIAVYLVMMLRNVANLSRSLGEAIALRFDNAAIVEQLRAAQAKAEKLNDDLRGRIEQHEATQRDLIKARDDAEGAARAKAEFLANMSHEIRTPMNGVLGLSELLLESGLNKRQTHLADMIHRSGRSLLNIINDVLDFSKIEAGKLTIQETAFDLRAFVEDLGEMFSENAHRAGIELACDMPAGLHVAYRGDPDRLRQVLTNLLSNAMKFTSRGEVVLRVESDGAGTRPRLRFAVADTGIGIAPENLERIFDSFTQADGSTTRKFGGTGLGLAICRQLVQLMGGQIGVESTPGRGSTFWFEVPLTMIDPAQLPTAHRLDPKAVAGQRALVVGSADTAREVLLGQLAAWGVETLPVTSGDEALTRLRAEHGRGQPVDAVIFPRDLPDLRAADFAAQVREAVAPKTIRTVMLTTVANLESTSDLLAAGVSAYVTKPVRQRDLHAALLAGADRRRAGSARGRDGGARTFRAHVLLVEDNLVNQELARSMLEACGCEVRLVGNGQEALDAVVDRPLDALREPYDLVLMDCQMPVMDGYAATAALRDWERTEGVARMPIVALTANALEGDREHCLAAGMDDYLAKPFSREQLQQLLGRWLPTVVPTVPPAVSMTSAPSALETPAAVLDRQMLDRIVALQREGAPDLLAHLIGLFRNGVPRLMSDIEMGTMSGDAVPVRRAAHTLKSSAANLGATSLAKLCGALEAQALAGELDAVAAQIDVLHFEMDGVLAALQALRPAAGVNPGAAKPKENRA